MDLASSAFCLVFGGKLWSVNELNLGGACVDSAAESLAREESCYNE